MADTPENLEQPVVTPEAAPAASPAPAAAPVETAAPETPAPEAAPAAQPEPEPTLLSEAKAPGAEEAKPAEAAAAEKPAEEVKAEGEKTEAKPEEKPEAKAEGDKPAEAATTEQPAELPPIEYKYELPETLTLSDDMRKEVHGAFDAFRKDPTNPQPLVDFHNKAMQAHDARIRQEQWDVFNNTRRDWRTAVMSDDMIGGAGHNTAMQAIARVRDRFVSDHNPGTKEYEADLSAFDGMLRATGVGDHPVLLRFMHRISQMVDEPTLPGATPNPSPNNGKRPGGRAATLYDNSPSMKRN